MNNRAVLAGLYIHIPKCASRCAYCDFYSALGVDGARLVEALKHEIASRRDFFRGGAKGVEGAPERAFSGLDTIYIGGGTPSLLTAAGLQSLLDCAREVFGVGPREPMPSRGRKSGTELPRREGETQSEITIEANPEDLTDDYLAALTTTGFNRLSVGIQSFDDRFLRLMNRRHTSERARRAVKSAQKEGFDNISIDLIYGIPGMDAKTLERTLKSALELGVQHISAYHLTIEPGTVFGRWAAGGRVVSPGGSPFGPIAEAESERQYATLREMLSEAGFEQYEISNFALPGRRARHNSAYWSGEPYLGIGPGAHSFDGRRTRSWVEPDVEKYLAHFADGAGREGAAGDFEGGIGFGSGDGDGSCGLGVRSVGSGEIYGSETLSDVDLRNERLMVGLRTVEGVRARDAGLRRRAEKFLHDGLLVELVDGGGRGRRIAIPAEKFLLSDYIIGSLFE